MTRDSRRYFFSAVVGLVLTTAVTACSGQPGATLPNRAGSLAFPTGAQRGALAPASTIVEFFNGITPNSNPRGITNGPHGMWFTQPGSNQIGHITTQGVVTEFNAPPNTVNNIVEGPDGNLWFTMGGADAIGRMSVHGKIKIFSTGNEAYGPFDITEGSDGNLWFSFRSPSTNAIGRITISGSVTLFTNGLSPGDVAVHDLTLGPDGNVWFTEEFGNRIGSITPNGTITEYSNGISAQAGLVDIATGPDNNLWFTENALNQIGRITTTGIVTEFSHGISPQAGVGSISSARNAVWFSETNIHSIGRISTTGNITETALPAALPSDVAQGPGSTLWITDYTGNGVVKFGP